MATEWRIWKTHFGWLPVMQDPINFTLTRTLARTWVFCLATAFSVVEVPFMCEFSTMSSKWWNCRLKEEKMPAIGSIVRPSCSSDLRDEGRSTLTVPLVKLTFFRDYCGSNDTASHKLRQKGNETCTHTHTQRAANCYGSHINLCCHQNGAMLTPIGLRSLTTTTTTTKIRLHFLSRYRTINGPHWAAEVFCTKWVSSHVLD